MKRTSRFFVWIVLFAIGLMITILVTQVNTVGLLGRLQKGNNQAAMTFSINNRLQEMVNQAFELENQFISIQSKKLQPPFNRLKDSLTRLGYNASILYQTVTSSADTSSLRSLVYFIEKQVGYSFELLEALEQKNDTLQKNLVDSLKDGHFGDSIYSRAISFQRSLEQNLSATLKQNNKLTSGLSSLNRVLAIVSLAAIILLATIIIRRQRKQLRLIKELDEARTQALHSANVKNQFLANMSHEIRTPLNALQGFSKLLHETKQDKEQKRYTGIIATASENLLNLVNDILDFSKIEAGALVIRNKPFNLSTAIHEIQNMFEAQAESKGLKLEFQTDANLPEMLVGDAGRLRQVLFNLVSNAIKFTETGKVQIISKQIADQEKQVKIKFIVADTGVGIPQDKMDTIFERFEQLDNSLSRHHGGTGLGLAITKRLIEMMGGIIEVKSVLHKGSEFTVEMEFEKWKRAAEIIPSSWELPDQTRTADVSNAIVLVVEDNPMNQMLMEILLQRNGIKFSTVNNGLEALDFLKSQIPDLVLMDVQMPEMDGLETTRHLREKMGYHLPIIAMTAHVLPGEKERCIEAGMSDYLSKPIDEIKLLQMLQQYLGINDELKKADIQIPSVTKGDLNLNYLLQICNNDKEKVVGILHQLAEQLGHDLPVLNQALENKDMDKLRSICHHLKSTLSPLDEDNEAPVALQSFNHIIHKESDWQIIIPEGEKLSAKLEKTILLLNNPIVNS